MTKTKNASVTRAAFLKEGGGAGNARSEFDRRASVPKQLHPHELERILANARAAHEETCARCGRPVLRGLDGDVLAFTAHADPDRVTAAGELLARAEGRAPYRVRSGSGRPELWVRDSWQIGGEPANLRSGPGAVAVLVEHRCAP